MESGVSTEENPVVGAGRLDTPAFPLEPLSSGQLNFLRPGIVSPGCVGSTRSVDGAFLGDDSRQLESESSPYQSSSHASYETRAHSSKRTAGRAYNLSRRRSSRRARSASLGAAESAAVERDVSPGVKQRAFLASQVAQTPESVSLGLDDAGFAVASAGPGGARQSFDEAPAGVVASDAGSPGDDPGAPSMSIVSDQTDRKSRLQAHVRRTAAMDPPGATGRGPEAAIGGAMAGRRPPRQPLQRESEAFSRRRMSESRASVGSRASRGSSHRQRRAPLGAFGSRAASIAQSSSSSSDDDTNGAPPRGSRAGGFRASHGAAAASSRQARVRRDSSSLRFRPPARPPAYSGFSDSSDSDSDVGGDSGRPVHLGQSRSRVPPVKGRVRPPALPHQSGEANGVGVVSTPAAGRRHQAGGRADQRGKGLSSARAALREAASAAKESRYAQSAESNGRVVHRTAGRCAVGHEHDGGSSSEDARSGAGRGKMARVNAARRSLAYPGPTAKPAPIPPVEETSTSSSSESDDLLSTRRLPPGMRAIRRALRTSVKQARAAASPMQFDSGEAAGGEQRPARQRGKFINKRDVGPVSHLAGPLAQRRLSFSAGQRPLSRRPSGASAAAVTGHPVVRPTRRLGSGSLRRGAIDRAARRSIAASRPSDDGSSTDSEEERKDLGLPPPGALLGGYSPSSAPPSEPPTRAVSPVADDPTAHLAMSSSLREHAMSFRKKARQSVAPEQDKRSNSSATRPAAKAISILSDSSSSEDESGRRHPGDPRPSVLRPRGTAIATTKAGMKQNPRRRAASSAVSSSVQRSARQTPVLAPRQAVGRPAQRTGKLAVVRRYSNSVARSIVSSDSSSEEEAQAARPPLVGGRLGKQGLPSRQLAPKIGQRNKASQKGAMQQTGARMAIRRKASAVASSIVDSSSSESSDSEDGNIGRPRVEKSGQRTARVSPRLQPRTRPTPVPVQPKTREPSYRPVIPPIDTSLASPASASKPKEQQPPAKLSARSRKSSTSGSSGGWAVGGRRPSMAGSTSSSILGEDEAVATVYVSPDYPTSPKSAGIEPQRITTRQMLRAGSAFDRALGGGKSEAAESAALKRILARQRAAVGTTKTSGRWTVASGAGKRPPRPFGTGSPPPRPPIFAARRKQQGSRPIFGGRSVASAGTRRQRPVFQPRRSGYGRGAVSELPDDSSSSSSEEEEQDRIRRDRRSVALSAPTRAGGRPHLPQKSSKQPLFGSGDSSSSDDSDQF